MSEQTMDADLDGEWSPRQVVTHVVEWTVRASQQVLYVALSGELPTPSEIVLPTAPDELRRTSA